jgi:hypothetical protein
VEREIVDGVAAIQLGAVLELDERVCKTVVQKMLEPRYCFVLDTSGDDLPADTKMANFSSSACPSLRFSGYLSKWRRQSARRSTAAAAAKSSVPTHRRRRTGRPVRKGFLTACRTTAPTSASNHCREGKAASW